MMVSVSEPDTAPETASEKTPARKMMDGQWALAIAGAIAISLTVGHQWGLYDRSGVAVDVAAVASPSPSTSPSSTSAEPSPSTSGEAAGAADACKAANKYVESVVRRSDLAAEHPKPTDDGVTACRWVSPTYPRITVSVVAGSELGDVVGVLDDTWTDGAPMTNPRMYQYSGGSLTGYWADPDSATEGAAVIDGMSANSLPSDEGMAATSLAAQVAQAVTR